MKVSVYGIEFEFESADRTVGELIDMINDKGYAVTDIIADGQQIDNFSEEGIENLKPIQHLELNTKKIEELTFETLAEIERFIPDFISSLDEIINDLTIGNEGDAYKNIGQALETLDWLNQLLNNLDNIDFIKNYFPQDRDELINYWHKTVTILLDAFQNEDIVLLGDILEYELKPVLENYLKYVSNLSKVLTD